MQRLTREDLGGLPLDQLYALAARMKIERADGLTKKELLIAILKAQAAAEGFFWTEGILDLAGVEGSGFLRPINYAPSAEDVYISASQIRRFGLRTGDKVAGKARPPKENERYYGLLQVETVNGDDPEVAKRRAHFQALTPLYPNRPMHLETAGGDLAARVMDIAAPVGFGQRGLLVAPPKAGKTTLLKSIANAIAANYPRAELLVLLIDERPEEVTDLERSVAADVASSTFDEAPERHVRVAELVLARAQRLVEQGRDVVILLDSLTRLARAYNLVVSPSGRTLSGGIDPAALHRPKKFFGAARNVEEGGSLTILATALIETGSRMDEVIYEEFKGTGNLELHLDRSLAERRIFPALDWQRSGTRREELLLTGEQLAALWSLRRSFADVPDAGARLLEKLRRTPSNEAFLAALQAERSRSDAR